MTGHRYLIVAGATRCGTTSLFRYLADNPAVCASNLKETGYFLDPDYPLPVEVPFTRGLRAYESFFVQCTNEPVRLDATPDYLYSEGSAGRIASAVPEATLVFLLRDPVDRLVSWFRFARQLGRIPSAASFADYVDTQRKTAGRTAPQHLRSLEQGRYSRYLATFFEHFAADKLVLLRYEHLARETRTTLRELSRRIGIDEGFYDTYPFAVHNPSRTTRYAELTRAYVAFRDWARRRTRGHPWAKNALRPVGRQVQEAFYRANRGNERPVEIPDATARFLCEYYRDERVWLGSLATAGVRAPLGTTRSPSVPLPGTPRWD